MRHSFDIDLAKKYGVNASLLIQHFQAHCQISEKCNENFHEGRTWVRQSTKEMHSFFPYFTIDEIRELLIYLSNGKKRRSAIQDFDPILMRANLNKNAHDRTISYAFVKPLPIQSSRL